MTRQNIVRSMVGLGAGFVVAFSASVIVSAQSEALSAEMLQTIRSRCTNSQFALQQIEKRDAVSRINRGRAYDQMMRQVSAFNARLAYNKINTPDLVQLTAQMQEAVSAFRDRYDQYDTDIIDALKVNCKEKPEEYYSIIVRARDNRSALGDQVTRIADLMDQYHQAVVRHKESIQ